jgi:hypothetical protein
LDNKFTRIQRSLLFLPSKPVYYHHKKEKREVKNQKINKLASAGLTTEQTEVAAVDVQEGEGGRAAWRWGGGNGPGR